MRGAAMVGTAALVLLSACAERPQSAERGSVVKKSDSPPWDAGAAAPYSASGWKGGDQAAWTQQIRQRGQAQNDYVR